LCASFSGEVPLMAGPGDEIAAGRGDLRASHADREQVIETLKAAFVQGRLDRDELDSRVCQTLAARTYGELAGLTADLPAEPADAGPPGRAARAQTRPPMNNAAKAGIWVIIAVGVPMVLSFLSGGGVLFLLLTPFYFMGLAFLAAEIFTSRLKTRARRGQLPPGPGPGGPASQRLPSADPGRQLPPADPGRRDTPEAAQPSPPVVTDRKAAARMIATATAIPAALWAFVVFAPNSYVEDGGVALALVVLSSTLVWLICLLLVGADMLVSRKQKRSGGSLLPS
jgi:hypothetical protein